MHDVVLNADQSLCVDACIGPPARAERDSVVFGSEFEGPRTRREAAPVRALAEVVEIDVDEDRDQRQVHIKASQDGKDEGEQAARGRLKISALLVGHHDRCREDVESAYPRTDLA